jgi:hypothetical protein
VTRDANKQQDAVRCDHVHPFDGLRPLFGSKTLLRRGALISIAVAEAKSPP